MGTDLCFFASSRAAPRRSQHLSSCLCNSRKGKSAAGRGARFTLCGSSSSSDSERTRKRCLRESVLPVFTRWHRRDLCPLGIVGHLDWVTRFPYRLVVRDRSPLDRRGGRAANSRYMRQPLERRFGCLEQCSYAAHSRSGDRSHSSVDRPRCGSYPSRSHYSKVRCWSAGSGSCQEMAFFAWL
jgi:hypothetical protein